MTEIEIGRGKRGRGAYAFDDIAIVPSRRTRDPQDVSIAWQIDAYRFELPLLAAPMDSVVSPDTAIAIGRLGGVGVLNLEGLWTRYEDPTSLLARDRRALGRRGHVSDAGDVRRTDPARPRRRADRAGPCRRRHRSGVALAWTYGPALEVRGRRRASTCSSSAARRCLPSTSLVRRSRSTSSSSSTSSTSRSWSEALPPTRPPCT